MLGLIGKKIGMTQVFDEQGNLVSVTAVKVEPNVVVQSRTKEKHGYSAVVLGSVPVKIKRLVKPVVGQFPKGMEAVRYMTEIRDYGGECKPGDRFGVEVFEGIAFVDVQGTSKGKGTQGVMKRHGFRGGSKSHGSKFHREGGSTGMAASPSRMFKGRRMAGKMGNSRRTVQNLRVVSIDAENSLLLLKGSVPGPRNSLVIVRKAKKK